MQGCSVAYAVDDDPGPLLPLLVLGETCRVGSHASLGLGRYVLLPIGSWHEDAARDA